MPEQKGFCGEGTGATRTQEFGNGDKQVNGEDQQFAHERTLPWWPSDARLPGAGGFRHTSNSHPTGVDSQRILIRRFAVELADYPTRPLIVTAIATSAVKIMPHKIALSDSSLVRASAPRDICR